MPKIKSQSFQYRSANENAQNCIEIETREIIEYFNITSNRWKSIRKARCCKFKQFWKLPILFDIIGFWWLLFVLSTMCPSHCCILPMNWNAHLEIWVRMKRHRISIFGKFILFWLLWVKPFLDHPFAFEMMHTLMNLTQTSTNRRTSLYVC